MSKDPCEIAVHVQRQELIWPTQAGQEWLTTANKLRRRSSGSRQPGAPITMDNLAGSAPYNEAADIIESAPRSGYEIPPRLHIGELTPARAAWENAMNDLEKRNSSANIETPAPKTETIDTTGRFSPIVEGYRRNGNVQIHVHLSQGNSTNDLNAAVAAARALMTNRVNDFDQKEFTEIFASVLTSDADIATSEGGNWTEVRPATPASTGLWRLKL
jgi:hypothetical protein